MNTNMRLVLALPLLLSANKVVSAPVRSSCPDGDCASSDISPYFYLFIFLIFAAGATYNIFKGNKDEKRKGILFFVATLKLIFLFVCLPFLIGYFFDPSKGIYSFFGIMLIVIFSERLGAWIFGKENN